LRAARFTNRPELPSTRLEPEERERLRRRDFFEVASDIRGPDETEMPRLRRIERIPSRSRFGRGVHHPGNEPISPFTFARAQGQPVLTSRRIRARRELELHPGRGRRESRIMRKKRERLRAHA